MVIRAQDVELALDNEEFFPHFQPIVELRTGELRGFEILARWNHPHKGPIRPDEFIPLAERDGWLGPLTGALLNKSFSAVIEQQLARHLFLAINISPLQLRDVGLPRRIQQAAELAGFSLERLMVEITETALFDDMKQARSITYNLKSMGCRLALDDFGTGYSSLTHLESLPFDELKVDRSFVSSMTESRESRKIVAAVVGLGQSLGLTTVAEGVETREQAEMLLWLDCDLAQGWFYGQPSSSEQLNSVTASSPRLLSNELPRKSAGGHVSYVGLDSMPGQRLAQLQAVYDGAPVGLAFIDKNMRYKNVNRRFANLTGHRMEELIGRTVPEMVPEIFPLIQPHILKALSGQPVEGLELTRPLSMPKGGNTVLISYEPALDEGGEVVGVSTAVMDITALKRAEQGWRDSEENYRHMLELLPQIPWIIDPQGRALDVSRRWLQLSGMDGDEWRGFGWIDALHPDDRQPTLDAIRNALKDHEPINVKYRLRAKGEDWKWMLSRGYARTRPDGTIMCWYGSLEEMDPQPEA